MGGGSIYRRSAFPSFGCDRRVAEVDDVWEGTSEGRTWAHSAGNPLFEFLTLRVSPPARPELIASFLEASWRLS